MKSLEIQLIENPNGFDGQINYKGEIITAEGKSKSYIKARLAKLLSRKSVEGVTFTFVDAINNIKATKAVMKKTPEEKKVEVKTTTIPKASKSKIDVKTLPIYSNPTLVSAGDKAKFHFDKAQTDWSIVDILKVSEASHGGWYIYWIFETTENREKYYRTYVRKGNPGADEPEFIVGTTITGASIKQIINNNDFL